MSVNKSQKQRVSNTDVTPPAPKHISCLSTNNQAALVKHNKHLSLKSDIPSPHLLSGADAATFQHVDVIATLAHEAADQPVVTENNGGHLGDVLVALVVGDVATVIYKAGNQVTFPQLLRGTFFNLNGEKRRRHFSESWSINLPLKAPRVTCPEQRGLNTSD